MGSLRRAWYPPNQPPRHPPPRPLVSDRAEAPGESAPRYRAVDATRSSRRSGGRQLSSLLVLGAIFVAGYVLFKGGPSATFILFGSTGFVMPGWKVLAGAGAVLIGVWGLHIAAPPGRSRRLRWYHRLELAPTVMVIVCIAFVVVVLATSEPAEHYHERVGAGRAPTVAEDVAYHAAADLINTSDPTREAYQLMQQLDATAQVSGNAAIKQGGTAAVASLDRGDPDGFRSHMLALGQACAGAGSPIQTK